MKTAEHPPRAARGRPVTGQAVPAAERTRQYRARRKAAGLQPVVEWRAVREEAVIPYSPHRLAEARSLAMHTVIAQRLLRDSTIIEHARRNLRRWAAQRPGDKPRWMTEWRAILRRPVEEVAGLITEPSERGARLRQSTPFAGVLGELERQRIYDAFRT